MNIEINKTGIVNAPDGKFIISCGVNGDGSSTELEDMNREQIIEFLKENYMSALDSLIAFSDSDSYIVAEHCDDVKPSIEFVYEPKYDFDLVCLHCFVDIDKNNKMTTGEHLRLVKPTVYLTDPTFGK